MATSDPRGQPAGFGNLVGPGAQYAGVDQGIDFTGGPFPVFALGDALITRVLRAGSGWPGQGAVVNYRILTGPGKGKYVYVAEDFSPRPDLRPGSKVRAGDTIGTATGVGLAPGIEVGWARPSGIPLADRPPPRPAPQLTSIGEDFRQFVAGGSIGGKGATDAVGSAAAGAASAAAGAAKHVPGVQQAVDAYDATLSAGKFMGRITSPSYILRGLQILAGAILILVGLLLLGRQVALAADLPDPLANASPVKAVAGRLG